jgi:hypothetical protein
VQGGRTRSESAVLNPFPYLLALLQEGSLRFDPVGPGRFFGIQHIGDFVHVLVPIAI